MSGKRLLKNVLAHTGTQNKMQEEREMWRLRALEKGCRWEDRCTYESRSMLTRGRLLSDSLLSNPPSPPSPTGLHRGPPPDDHTARGERRKERTEGYWTRRLLKQEEQDPSRWGHSGYKEIYAEEFASSESENGDNERTSHKGKQRGRHKKNKVKSETLGSDGTHRRKRKRRHDSSGSEPSSDEERRRRRLKRKKKRDMRKKEKRKRSPSTSDTK